MAVASRQRSWMWQAQTRAENKPREDRRSHGGSGGGLGSMGSLGGSGGGLGSMGSLGRSGGGLGSAISFGGSVGGISSTVESVVRMGRMSVRVELFFSYTLLSLSHPTNARDVESGGKS